MTTEDQIRDYLASLPEPKAQELKLLHELAMDAMPGCQLWYLDGLDATGKVVSNPNIGYGAYTIAYANGTTKEFYRVGISANTSGISVYIMGLADKEYLAKTYGPNLGKARVTGYCIKFKSIKDIDLEVLRAAIKERFESPN